MLATKAKIATRVNGTSATSAVIFNVLEFGLTAMRLAVALEDCYSNRIVDKRRWLPCFGIAISNGANSMAIKPGGSHYPFKADGDPSSDRAKP